MMMVRRRRAFVDGNRAIDLAMFSPPTGWIEVATAAADWPARAQGTTSEF
jgi:hypothetical protein